MRLWLSLGALIAFAVLGALCWHRGAEIEDLNRELGLVQQQNSQLATDITVQNGAVKILADEAVANERKAKAVMLEARRTRAGYDRRAQEILFIPPVEADACKEAERLMEMYHAESN